MSRWRRFDEEEKVAPTRAPLRRSTSEPTPAVQRLLELQRSAGNQAIAAALSGRVVQRDGPARSDVPLKLQLLDLRGVSSVICPDPKPPWLPKASARPEAKEPADADDASKVWNLDFDLDVKEGSALADELARADRIRQIASGGKGDADTPLGLQLSNAAVNILANTDKGKELASKLYLDHFSVVADPSSGKYGLVARFTFGGK